MQIRIDEDTAISQSVNCYSRERRKQDPPHKFAPMGERRAWGQVTPACCSVGITHCESKSHVYDSERV